MKNPKILIPIVVLIIGLFAGKTLFASGAPTKEVKPKVHGETYVLPKDFLVNLKDGRFAKLNVGLILKHGYLAEAVAAAAGGHGAPAAPEGYGTLPQEAIVRDIITDELTDADSSELVNATKRRALKVTIAKSIKAHTDVQLEDVLLTDVAVQ